MTTNERLAALRARLNEAVRFHPREAVALGVVGVMLVAGAGLAYARSRPVAASALEPSEPAAAAETSATGPIVVHVVGAVREPGVYELPDGSRVIDAVRAAGGFRRKADPTGLNLARTLADGEQIVVPERARPGAAPATVGVDGNAEGKVNINLAGPSDLETLPGIGPVLAGRIVAYRDQHGPFRSVRDLLKVSGIGPKTFEALEAAVTV